MDITKDPFEQWLGKSYKYIIQNKKLALAVLGGLVVFIVFISWYLIRQGQVQANAHKDFVYAMEYFNAPVVSKESKSVSFDTKEFTSADAKWSKVEELFKRAYENNKSAGLAPIFLAYQSEALLNQDKLKEATDILKKSVGFISDKDLKSYYQVKLALMQIDSGDESLKQGGIAILKELAVNDKCAANDRALYHLGDYYWQNKNFDEAKNYWNQLILKYGKSSLKPSLFAANAKPRLKLISFKS
ncbi:MAG: hypothetical protein ABIA74_00665 [bacterium]